MIAKNLPFLLFLALIGLTSAARADDQLPRTQKFARYEAMVKHSPFAIATAAGPAGATPDFAKDLYVANAAHTANGDFVSIASTTDKNLKEYLNSKEPVDGYTISNIQWSEHVGETKVTIAKDGQFATLTFNEALLSQAIQNTVPMAQPQPPGMLEVDEQHADLAALRDVAHRQKHPVAVVIRERDGVLIEHSHEPRLAPLV